MSRRECGGRAFTKEENLHLRVKLLSERSRSWPELPLPTHFFEIWKEVTISGLCVLRFRDVMRCYLVRLCSQHSRCCHHSQELKLGRSHWQPFFISQDQAFLFANTLTPSACAHVSTCMTFCWRTSGVYFFHGRKEQDNKSNCLGVQLESRSTSFLSRDQDQRIYNLGGHKPAHARCTHSINPFEGRPQMSGAWCLCAGSPPQVLMEYFEQSTICSRLTRNRQSLRALGL